MESRKGDSKEAKMGQRGPKLSGIEDKISGFEQRLRNTLRRDYKE